MKQTDLKEKACHAFYTKLKKKKTLSNCLCVGVGSVKIIHSVTVIASRGVCIFQNSSDSTL